MKRLCLNACDVGGLVEGKAYNIKMATSNEKMCYVFDIDSDVKIGLYFANRFKIIEEDFIKF